MPNIDILKRNICDACGRTTVNTNPVYNTYDLEFKHLSKPVKLCEDCLAELYALLKLRLVEDGLQDKAQDLYLKKIDEVVG